MAIIYPIIAFLLLSMMFVLLSILQETVEALSALGSRIIGLAPADILILACGWGGALVAGSPLKHYEKGLSDVFKQELLLVGVSFLFYPLFIMAVFCENS